MPKKSVRSTKALPSRSLKHGATGSGFYYWNYKLLTDTVNTPGWIGWDSWDLGRCIAQSWFPLPPIL